MKRINKNLLEALDKLIAKYSGEEIVYNNKIMKCSLCDIFLNNRNPINSACTECPNKYFGGDVGCRDRAYNYPSLDYLKISNYPTLKQFWTDYKSLYLQRKYSNSEIMEILIKPFK